MRQPAISLLTLVALIQLIGTTTEAAEATISARSPSREATEQELASLAEAVARCSTPDGTRLALLRASSWGWGTPTELVAALNVEGSPPPPPWEHELAEGLDRAASGRCDPPMAGSVQEELARGGGRLLHAETSGRLLAIAARGQACTSARRRALEALVADVPDRGMDVLQRLTVAESEPGPVRIAAACELGRRHQLVPASFRAALAAALLGAEGDTPTADSLIGLLGTLCGSPVGPSPEVDRVVLEHRTPTAYLLATVQGPSLRSQADPRTGLIEARMLAIATSVDAERDARIVAFTYIADSWLDQRVANLFVSIAGASPDDALIGGLRKTIEYRLTPAEVATAEASLARLSRAPGARGANR